jgi:hypothetical protein
MQISRGGLSLNSLRRLISTPNELSSISVLIETPSSHLNTHILMTFSKIRSAADSLCEPL